MNRLSTAVTLLVLSSALAGAQTVPPISFGHAVLLSLNSGDHNQFEPSIAADGGGGVYVAWKDGQSGSSHIRYCCSHDYGATWSQDVRMDEPDYAHQSDPVVIAAPDGSVSVSWIAYTSGTETAVNMQVSTDRGRTFGKSMKQCLPTSEEAKDFFDRQWQVRDGAQVLTSYHVFNRIYVARSEDGGKTIVGVSQPDGDRRACLSAVMTKAPDGTVHIAWLQIGRGMALRYSKSADGGKTWAEPRTLAQMRRLDFRGRAQCFMTIANDSLGNVFLAWVEGKGRDGEGDPAGGVYFIRSEDGGATWSDPLKVSDDEEAKGHDKIQAWMHVDAQDRVHLVWLDRRAERWYVRYALSSDRGESFQPTVAASSPHLITSEYQSDFISVTTDDRYLYIAAPLPVGGVYSMHVMRTPLSAAAFPAPAPVSR